jgi:type IV pilus assembly protein PilE
MRRVTGFTLIELMITVAIIAILGAIAYPTYQNYGVRARRSDAHQLMTLISLKQSQYILDARSYTEKLGSNGLNLAKDGWTCGDANCTNDYYTVVAAPDMTTTPPSFVITATPKSGTAQQSDGNLTLNSAGTKTGKW